jgi:hypothetical protein
VLARQAGEGPDLVDDVRLLHGLLRSWNPAERAGRSPRARPQGMVEAGQDGTSQWPAGTAGGIRTRPPARPVTAAGPPGSLT